MTQQPYDTSGDTACTELTCPAHGELNRLRADLARKDETIRGLVMAAASDVSRALARVEQAERERDEWQDSADDETVWRQHWEKRAEQAERQVREIRESAETLLRTAARPTLHSATAQVNADALDQLRAALSGVSGPTTRANSKQLQGLEFAPPSERPTTEGASDG